jgi:hypothetical protein
VKTLRGLLGNYYLDESDPDIVVLRRQDSSFAAAFSASGATREEIREAAEEDYRGLQARWFAGEEGEPAPSLDELPEHVAIVDGSGTIVAVNEAWKAFAEANGAELRKVLEGVNYLEVCDAAKGEQSESASAFAEGLRRVISGREERFALEYPCHSPTERRWFMGRVRRFESSGTELAIVTHEEITWRRLMAHADRAVWSA